MSAGSHETPKKSSSVLEKLGQKISNIREDIADNLERRKQSYNQTNSNQVHFITRTQTSEDSLVIEKKPPTPPEIRQRQPSGKQRVHLISSQIPHPHPQLIPGAFSSSVRLSIEQ